MSPARFHYLCEAFAMPCVNGGYRATCAFRGDVLVAQGGRCSICGERIERREVSWDHTTPRALGGFDGPGNLTVAHRACNGEKSDRAPNGCDLIWLAAVNARLLIPTACLAELRNAA